MKPLELRLRDFGAFRGEAVVDFRRLDELFLICGPTGAGKTTLFDAMTYALYGTALGSREKLPGQFLSHHAPTGSVPSVTLTFQIGAATWRVYRQPPYRRPKARGDGDVEEPTLVRLEESTPDGWKEVAALPSVLDKRLEELMGLSDKDFSKIVVLPQGEFQRFLEAPSKDRADMLEKLFPVEDYDRLAEAFKQQAQAVKKERDAVETQHRDLEERLGALGRDRPALEEELERRVAELVLLEERQTRLRLLQQKAQERRQTLQALEAARTQAQKFAQADAGMQTQRLRWEGALRARDLETDFRRQKEIFEEGKKIKALLETLEAQLAAANGQWEALNRDTHPEADDLQLEQSRERLQKAREAAQAWRQRREVLEGFEKAHSTCAESESQLKLAAQELGEAQARAVADEQFWNTLVDTVRDAERARALVDGEPCMVCGSTQHPRPAQVPENIPHPLDEILTRRAAAAAALQAVRDNALRVQAAVNAAEAAPSPDLKVALWSGSLEDLLQRVDARRKDLVAWKARRDASPEVAAEDPGLDLARLETEFEALRTQLRTAREKRESLAVLLSKLRAEAAQTQLRREESLARYQGHKKRVDEGLAERGWTYDDLTAALMTSADLERLQTQLETHDQQKLRAQGELRAREADWAALPPEEPAPSPEEAARVQAEKTATEQALAQVRHHLNEWDRLEGQYREVSALRRDLQAKADTLVPLAKTLDGDNARNLKLKTWVLIQYLEQVTRSATLRLTVLSGGRYSLRVQTQGTDARMKWGLDLAVLDSQTGIERPVGTLSGGEKFMTSISLALGLADVIQEKAGGIRLEALFIDEGFGSLDDQTLDRAMAVLHELGKNRTVGIISHVAELRTRIVSQLEVVKGRNGSTLRLA